MQTGARRAVLPLVLADFNRTACAVAAPNGPHATGARRPNPHI